MVLARNARPVAYEQQTFRGMRDSFDPSASRPDLCYVLRNSYPSDHEEGAGVLGRAGCNRTGLGGLEQGGSGSHRRPQCIGQLTKADGTEVTFRVVGGLLDTYDWSTDTWANVALSGVSLPTSGKVFWIQYGQAVVFQPNDGANKPFTWDGVTTFVSLTNCPLLWGPLTVYYAKLFGVKWASRITFVWSEENDATIGYDTAPYNNAWDYLQTSSDALYALVGSNEALYIWRERGLSYVLGAVTPDFQSQGTKQGVSETIGTKSPGGMVIHEREVYFLDADARPWCLTFGGGLTPLWADVAETARRIPRTYLGDCEAADFTPLGFALIGYRGPDGANLNRIYVIDTITKAIAGLWDGWEFQCLGMVKDSTGTKKLMRGSPNGYVYLHGNPDELDIVDDTMNAADGGTLAIYHEVQGPALGYDTKDLKWFDQLDLAAMCYSDMTDLTLDYETPKGRSAAALVQSITGAFPVWDVDTWDGGDWPSDAVEKHLAYGLANECRWLRPRLRHQALGERFSMTGWTLRGSTAGDEPKAA